MVVVGGRSYLGLILGSISRHPGEQMSQIHFFGLICKERRISTFDHAAVYTVRAMKVVLLSDLFVSTTLQTPLHSHVHGRYTVRSSAFMFIRAWQFVAARWMDGRMDR